MYEKCTDNIKIGRIKQIFDLTRYVFLMNMRYLPNLQCIFILIIYYHHAIKFHLQHYYFGQNICLMKNTKMEYLLCIWVSNIFI